MEEREKWVVQLLNLENNTLDYLEDERDPKIKHTGIDFCMNVIAFYNTNKMKFKFSSLVPIDTYNEGERIVRYCISRVKLFFPLITAGDLTIQLNSNNVVTLRRRLIYGPVILTIIMCLWRKDENKVNQELKILKDIGRNIINKMKVTEESKEFKCNIMKLFVGDSKYNEEKIEKFIGLIGKKCPKLIEIYM